MGLRDVPRVPRLRRAARHRAQLRRVRRPHRGAPLRDGRRRATSASATDDELAAMADGRARGDGRRRGRASRRRSRADAQRRRRPAGAVAARRHRRAGSARHAAARARQGRRRVHARARRSSTPTSTTMQKRIGRPFTWTALLTRQGLPRGTRTWRRTTRGAGRGRRGVAAGHVPAAHVPDEPARAVHVQHGAGVRRS